MTNMLLSRLNRLTVSARTAAAEVLAVLAPAPAPTGMTDSDAVIIDPTALPPQHHSASSAQTPPPNQAAINDLMQPSRWSPQHSHRNQGEFSPGRSQPHPHSPEGHRRPQGTAHACATAAPTRQPGRAAAAEENRITHKPDDASAVATPVSRTEAAQRQRAVMATRSVPSPAGPLPTAASPRNAGRAAETRSIAPRADVIVFARDAQRRAKRLSNDKQKK